MGKEDKKAAEQRQERRLIERTLKGELSAFEALVEKYQKPIFYHALKLMRDEEEAKDVAQEAFIKAFENLESFDLTRRFSPWLYRIATNAGYDRLRKQSRVSRLDWEVKDDEQEDKWIKNIDSQKRSKAVEEAVSELPKKYRQPVRLFYFENFDVKRIGKKLELPVNTVKTRLRRARGMLEKKLRAYNGTGIT